jgi:hypothetical protein
MTKPVVRFKGNKLDPASVNALVADTLIQGATLGQWWRGQARGFQQAFMREIRTAMANGESLTQATVRVVGGTVDGVTVPGIMKTTKRKAAALVSTAINSVSNRAALESFQANSDVINSELPFNGGPPRHFNCRSRLSPVTKSFRELGLDKDEIPPGTRASLDGQVPADITFDTWLKTKSTTFQNKLLGTKRAELWRKDAITLTQLVDFRGFPLALEQLEDRISNE